MATVCCRIVLPCLSKTVPHTCQSGRPLGSSCGAMQTSVTTGPRSLPKTGNRHTGKIGPTGSTRAQESCETGEIVADGVSSSGLRQTKRSVTVDRDVDLCSSQHSVLSFVLCFLFSDVSQVAHFLGHVAVDRSSWILCLSLLCVRFTFLFQGVYCLHSVCCGAGLLGKSCYSQFVRSN